MTTESKIRKGVEERLHSLHIAPASDGSDIGILDAVINKAKDTVLTVSGFDKVPDELIGAASDLAAADYAEYILTSDAGAGTLSSKSDGDYSVKYKDGTSKEERLFAMAEKMRARGIDATNAFRKIRW